MSLFVIGDPHLSFGCQKPMDIFKGWENHAVRLEENWKDVVGENDTVVLPGDISWAMNFEELLPDFQFLHRLPGKKVILKGNHDYWWSTQNKMDHFLLQNGLDSIEMLHNSCICAEGFRLCGTRGWLFENGQPHDEKVLAREAGRLRLSLDAAKKKGRGTAGFSALSSGFWPGSQPTDFRGVAGISNSKGILWSYPRERMFPCA